MTRFSLNSPNESYIVLNSKTSPHVWATGSRFNPVLRLKLILIFSIGKFEQPVQKHKQFVNISGERFRTYLFKNSITLAWHAVSSCSPEIILLSTFLPFGSAIRYTLYVHPTSKILFQWK